MSATIKKNTQNAHHSQFQALPDRFSNENPRKSQEKE
jgi:hypothetical protein